MKIDWSKSPEGAEFYAVEKFRAEKADANPIFWNSKIDGWGSGLYAMDECMESEDFERNPNPRSQWQSESRIDIIGTNGNDGSHYDEVLHHTERQANENVFKLSIEPKFMLEQELFEKLHDLVHQYDGRLSVVACIGAL